MIRLLAKYVVGNQTAEKKKKVDVIVSGEYLFQLRLIIAKNVQEFRVITSNSRA